VALATAAEVGDARGRAGAGVIARAVGRTVGAGGFGDGRAEGADVGTGEGAALGGIFTATEIGAVVGTLTGAAGSSWLGCVSKMFAVGCGFGWGVCWGTGRGFGGALGEIFASSCRLTGIRCAWGCAIGACRTGAIVGTCGSGATARTAAG